MREPSKKRKTAKSMEKQPKTFKNIEKHKNHQQTVKNDQKPLKMLKKR